MKGFLAISIVICLALFQDASAKIKVLRESHVNLEKRLVFDYKSFVNERLTYALCDKNPSREEVKCTVIHEKRPYSDDTYSCNVTLKRGVHTGKYEPQIQLVPFGKHNVALYSWELGIHAENKFLRFSIVQLDSCKVAEAKIDTASELSHRFDYTIVGHSDSFEVFYRNDKVSCAGKTCKVIVDVEGKFTEPIPSVERLIRADRARQPIVSLDQDSSAKGYIYASEEKEEYVQHLVRPDGTEKILARHPTQAGGVGVTTKNNLIGVCCQTNSEYKCSQYDFEGNLKLHIENPRGYKEKMLLNDLHNAPNGGLYLLSRVICERSPDGYVGECHDGISRLVIERIDVNGAKSEPVTIQVPAEYLSFAYHLLPLFYENERKETCLSLVAYDSGDTTGPPEGKGHLHLTANCFTDADFTK